MTAAVPPQARLSVLLADDHPLVLAGMQALVRADPGLELVGEAEDGPGALRQALALAPDVVVLDLGMPGLSGLEVARRLLQARPQSRVLVLSAHEDPAFLRRALEIGVAGYVLKRSATAELLRGIRTVAAGGTHIDPALAMSVGTGPGAGWLPHGLAHGAGAHDPDAHGAAPPDAERHCAELSAREIEVLRLTAAGNSNKTIAARLAIGVKTVETYKARAMAKLGFHSRVELVRFALAKGWLGHG